MVTLFSFSSIFFPQKCISFFFSFTHCFNKIVKSKCKTTLSKLVKDNSCYIFLIWGIQTFRGLKKKYIYTFKIKDVKVYGYLHRLYRPSKYIFLLCNLLLTKVMEKYLLMYLYSSKLHVMKKCQSAR